MEYSTPTESPDFKTNQSLFHLEKYSDVHIKSFVKIPRAKYYEC